MRRGPPECAVGEGPENVINLLLADELRIDGDGVVRSTLSLAAEFGRGANIV